MIGIVSNIFEIFDMWGVTCSSRISLKIDIPTLPVAVSLSDFFVSLYSFRIW